MPRQIIEDRAVVVVDHVVKRRNIEPAADACKSGENFVLRFVCKDRVNKLVSKYLAFADGDNVGKIGDRLGIKKLCRSAHYDERVIMIAIGGPDGNARELQHPGHVEVIGLK